MPEPVASYAYRPTRIGHPRGCACLTCADHRARRGFRPVLPLWSRRLASGLGINGVPRRIAS